jgi:hypothetical protein
MDSKSQGEEYDKEGKDRSTQFLCSINIICDSYEVGSRGFNECETKDVHGLCCVIQLVFKLQSMRHEGATTL